MNGDESRGELKIFACDSAKEFSEEVIKRINTQWDLELELNGSEDVWFSDGEVKRRLSRSVRGSDTYLIQLLQDRSHIEEGEYDQHRSVNDNLMALLAGLDALRRCGANDVTAVIPYFAYARQEKQKEREPISARLVADFIQDAGANGVFSMDVHSEAIGGFFKIPFDNLRASPVIIEYLLKGYGDLVARSKVGTPDAGGADRANYYAKKLMRPLVVAYKTRDYSRPDEVENIEIIGDVQDQEVIYIDDLVSTAGTLKKVVEKSTEKGAKGVYTVATHGVLDGPAEVRLRELYDNGKGPLKGLIITDTVKHAQSFLERNAEWLTVISVTNIFAEAIYQSNHNSSVSKLLDYRPK